LLGNNLSTVFPNRKATASDKQKPFKELRFKIKGEKGEGIVVCKLESQSPNNILEVSLIVTTGINARTKKSFNKDLFNHPRL